MCEVHESGVYESAIEVVETIAWLEAYRFLELCESVVYLVEHHHTITSICIVLWVFIIESDRSTKVIHSLLIMSNRHKGIPSISVIFCMS